MKVVGDIIQGCSVLTLQKVKSEYGTNDDVFFKFLQVQNSALFNLKEFTGGLTISPVEFILVHNMQLKSFTKKL